MYSLTSWQAVAGSHYLKLAVRGIWHFTKNLSALVASSVLTSLVVCIENVG